MGPDRHLPRRTVPLLISVTGFLLLAWSIVDPIYLLAISSPDVYRLQYAIGCVTIVPSCLLMIGYSRWLPEAEIAEEYHATIGLFGFVGGVGFLVFNLFLTGGSAKTHPFRGGRKCVRSRMFTSAIAGATPQPQSNI